MTDAIVVGAGHNGLVAANLLADAGWDVVVLEAQDTLGGAVRSDRSVHPAYISDLFSAFYPLGAASPVLRQLDLTACGLSWSHAPAVLAHVFPDNRCALLSRDVEATAACLDEFAVGDGAAWLELVREFERIQQPFLDTLFRPFPPVMPAVRLLRMLGLGGGLRFARFGLMSVRRFGDETFRGEAGPLLLAGNALHTDLPPEGAGSAVYGWLLAMLGQVYGFPVPTGGAGALVSALVTRLSGRVEVRTASPVTSILVEHGTAAGVRLASGETLRAKAVLADVSAPALFAQLVGLRHLPAGLAKDLDRFQFDAPTLKINWALSGHIPWTAAGARQAGTVHLGVDLDGLSEYATALSTRRLPDRPFVLLGQMSTADPTRSPAGTESAWAYTHLPERLTLTPDDVGRHVDRIEATIEAHAPGFRSLIRARSVQAPADLEREDANLVHGAVNGGTAALHQQLVLRPVPGLGRAETPIDRLYLASSAAHPGGGVHGGPGANAARAALARAGLGGGVRARALRTLMGRIYAD
jgi:phytoene dehydrogenase-like protein